MFLFPLLVHAPVIFLINNIHPPGDKERQGTYSCVSTTFIPLFTIDCWHKEPKSSIEEFLFLEREPSGWWLFIVMLLVQPPLFMLRLTLCGPLLGWQIYKHCTSDST